MRSSVAFALISLNVAGWATLAAAEESTQGATEKHGKIVATARRAVDTTHGTSRAPEHFATAAAANLGGASAAATASAMQPPPVNAAANMMLAWHGRYRGDYIPAAVTAVALHAGIDRTGAVAGFGSGAQTATLRPMGTGVVAGNIVTVDVRPDASVQPSGVLAVGSVLSAAAAATWQSHLTWGIESTNVRAAAVADAPNGGAFASRPTGTTPRAVGVWTSATDAVNRVRPAHRKR